MTTNIQTANQNPQNAAFDTTTPASRISNTFEKARREGRGILIPYFMCGYPSTAQCIELVLAAVQAGADMIELGIPFSDPLADGATIQHAGHAALEGGMTIEGCMEIARQISSQCETPVIFMGYYNPILAYGIERFCQHAAANGICGLIIPDLPPEEAAPLQDAAQKHGISLNFLIPPTASDERIIQILKAASDTSSFIYCVSLSGVTGARATLSPHLRDFIARVYGYRKNDSLPVAVGFGLSTPEHIAEVFSFADGAVVGSALVKIIDQYDEGEQVEAVRRYIKSLLRNTSE
ncbi:MAG TPA: tryptophan synthase subunit alpha [Ktedonobacteraceae bacterium]|jgi:tryptophan synthase alpha chain|nr:tryptophan synthase subunit alpha [Ktedonobacteraceae bacterium]